MYTVVSMLSLEDSMKPFHLCLDFGLMYDVLFKIRQRLSRYQANVVAAKALDEEGLGHKWYKIYREYRQVWV